MLVEVSSSAVCRGNRKGDAIATDGVVVLVFASNMDALETQRFWLPAIKLSTFVKFDLSSRGFSSRLEIPCDVSSSRTCRYCQQCLQSC